MTVWQALADLDRFLDAYKPEEPLPPLTNWGAMCGIPDKLWRTYMRGRWKAQGNRWREAREKRKAWQRAKVIELHAIDPPIPYSEIAQAAGLSFAVARRICAEAELAGADP